LVEEKISLRQKTESSPSTSYLIHLLTFITGCDVQILRCPLFRDERLWLRVHTES